MRDLPTVEGLPWRHPHAVVLLTFHRVTTCQVVPLIKVIDGAIRGRMVAIPLGSIAMTVAHHPRLRGLVRPTGGHGEGHVVETQEERQERRV